jgi:hypothetical protein
LVLACAFILVARHVQHDVCRENLPTVRAEVDVNNHGYTRQADDFDHIDMRGSISPEARIINVADALVKACESGRHEGRAWEITSAAKQLREMLERHFAGNLPVLKDDGLEF